MPLVRSSCLRLVPVGALALTSGCMTPQPRPMDYETCAASSVCVLHGVATARLAEHAPTVQLDLSDGRCVNVSMPRDRLEQLRLSGPRELTVAGNVYQEPSTVDGEEAVLEINGRKIGFGLCGNFFVFVPDGSPTGSRFRAAGIRPQPGIQPPPQRAAASGQAATAYERLFLECWDARPLGNSVYLLRFEAVIFPREGVLASSRRCPNRRLLLEFEDTPLPTGFNAFEHADLDRTRSIGIRGLAQVSIDREDQDHLLVAKVRRLVEGTELSNVERARVVAAME